MAVRVADGGGHAAGGRARGRAGARQDSDARGPDGARAVSDDRAGNAGSRARRRRGPALASGDSRRATISRRSSAGRRRRRRDALARGVGALPAARSRRGAASARAQRTIRLPTFGSGRVRGLAPALVTEAGVDSRRRRRGCATPSAIPTGASATEALRVLVQYDDDASFAVVLEALDRRTRGCRCRRLNRSADSRRAPTSSCRVSWPRPRRRRPMSLRMSCADAAGRARA